MQKVGDKYVKEEFRQHKGASEEFVTQFMKQWELYVETLEKQSQGPWGGF